MVNTGTKYGGRSIAPSRSGDHMKRMFEIIWLCRNAAPKWFGAELESCKEKMKIFLSGLSNILEERSSPSSHKHGIVGRNNDVLKSVLDRLS